MSLHLDRPTPVVRENRTTETSVQLATVEHYRLLVDETWDEPFDSEVI